MRMITFAKRCTKEIIRDPLNLCFGLGFPIVVLLLITTIQSNFSIEIFELKNFVPGITIFGLSFMTLFSATLVAKDRESSFLQRLYTTPMKPIDYILGYILPMIPIAIVQTTICYIIAFMLGLRFNINIFYAICMSIPLSILFISLGLLCGSIFNVKQVGSICGALLTNLTAWLSGAWFDLSLMGSFLNKIATFLPFVHAVEIERAILNKDYLGILGHLYPIIIYIIIIMISAILVFLRKMKKQ